MHNSGFYAAFSLLHNVTYIISQSIFQCRILLSGVRALPRRSAVNSILIGAPCTLGPSIGGPTVLWTWKGRAHGSKHALPVKTLEKREARLQQVHGRLASETAERQARLQQMSAHATSPMLRHPIMPAFA